jgi:ABC-type glycerol-3-phosphate transport system substrate-binding protein
LFAQVAAEFQKLYPHITVNQVATPAAVLQEKILAATTAGTPPAISYLDRQNYLSYAVRNMIQPLDALIKQERIVVGEYYEGDIRSLTYQGKIFMLPSYAGAGRTLLWYNKRLLAEAGLSRPPQTWNEFEEAERKLTLKDGTELKRVAFAGERYKRWLYAAGGKWASDDGRTVQFHSGPGADVMEWAKRRSDSTYGGWAARAAFASVRSAASQRGGFFTSELAMTVAHNGIIFDHQQHAKDMPMGVGATPAQRPEFPPAVSEYLAGYALSQSTPTPAQAFQFMRYVSYDDRGVGWFFREQGRPSPVKKQNQHPDLKKLTPDWDIMLAAMAREVGIANTGVDGEIDQIVDPLFTDVLSGKQVARQGLQQAAVTAQQRVDAFWASVPKSAK